jgi:hypothetical protein
MSRVWVFVLVFAAGGAAAASPPTDVNVHGYSNLTEPQVQRAVDALQSCRSDRRANSGVRILMSKDASGIFHVRGFLREPGAGDDPGLDACLRRTVDALRLPASSTNPEADLTLSWPATTEKASTPKTLADDDRALCAAGQRLLAASDRSRPCSGSRWPSRKASHRRAGWQ